jgi:putative membrane protein
MKKGLLMALVSLFVCGLMAVGALAAEKGLTSAEKSFMKNAASSGEMEVQLGKLAQQNGSSQAVKDFGKKMETDHTAANDQLKSLASQNNVQLPAQLERKHKSMVDKLSKLSGDKFDKTYMAGMVKDHEKDIKMFKAASKKAKEPALKQFIDSTLPTLEQHLDLAKQTAKQVGVKVK